MKLADKEFIFLSKEVLSSGKVLRFQARGGSMRPCIKSGDIINVEPSDATGVHSGDIVLFARGKDSFAVHRVIKKQKTKFLVKGDALAGNEEYILGESILGKVVSLERRGRCIHLCSKTARMRGYFFIFVSYWSFLIYPLFRFTKKIILLPIKKAFKVLQGLFFYRHMAGLFMRNKISIEIAGIDDVLELAYFYGYNLLPEFAQTLEDLQKRVMRPEESGYFIIAKRKGEIIGGLSLSWMDEEGAGNCGWIDVVRVHWLYRGMGIGKEIIFKAFSMVRRKNKEFIRLSCFHRRAGFFG